LVEFQLILSDPSTGKSMKIELKEGKARAFLGLKIGDEIDGSIIGVEGRIRITGGTDQSGFPLRADIPGGVKKRILSGKSVGIKEVERGERVRRLIRGNTITEDTYQINAVLIRPG